MTNRQAGSSSRPPREDVRARLLTAAQQEFRVRGYAGARVTEIARVAGFTKGAVYSNFDSKQGLFAAMLAEGADVLVADLLAGTDDLSFADGVRRVAEGLGAQIVADPQWHLLVLDFALQAGRDPEVRSVYLPQRRARRSVLADRVQTQAHTWGAVVIDGERIAAVLLALLLGLTVEHAADPDAVGEAEIADAVSAVLTGLLRRADAAVSPACRPANGLGE